MKVEQNHFFTKIR